MKEKKNLLSRKKYLHTLRRSLLLFLLLSFVITCSTLLFLSKSYGSLEIDLTEEQIRAAAVPTFLNVIVLSLLLTAGDVILRKFTVERPVRKIIRAAGKITEGDFSARVEPMNGLSGEGFDVIAEHMNKMAQELSGTETLQNDFIANVSHELKTPLAVIQNYATMLCRPELPEEMRLEYAKTVADASRRLADLVTNILKLNRLENQQIFPGKETYDLGEQLCECLLQFEDLWERKNIRLSTEIEDDVRIAADAELLTLVWNNLFSNAMKFTDPGGSVSVTLKKQDGFAVAEVSDTGCGISPEVGRHIFEKFYQGDTSHATQGNGLGLALVKRVIAIVGGDISVQSTVGVGSTFTVRLGGVQP